MATAKKPAAKKSAKPTPPPEPAPEWTPAPAPAPAPAAATPAPAPGGGSGMNERTYAMLLHLSALSGLVVSGIGFILGPLIMWLVKKDQWPSIDQQGRDAVNFQLTMLLALIVSAVLILVFIGFFLMIAVAVVDIVYVVMNAVKANNGEPVRYPMTIQFIKPRQA